MRGRRRQVCGKVRGRRLVVSDVKKVKEMN